MPKGRLRVQTDLRLALCAGQPYIFQSQPQVNPMRSAGMPRSSRPRYGVLAKAGDDALKLVHRRRRWRFQVSKF